MIRGIISFLKQTYKIVTVTMAVVIFFLVYHIYLVDHSLDNLRLALDRAGEVKTFEDAKRLAYMLDYSIISEVTQRQIQVSTFSRIELAKDILNKTQDISQLEDARFVLREAVVEKEKSRPPFLVALDRVNKIFAPLSQKFAWIKMEGRIKSLELMISLTQDKAMLQKQYYELAGLYTGLSHFKRANKIYQKVIALSPQTDLAKKSQFNIAWNEKKQGNLAESEEAFEKLAKIAPNSDLGVLSQFQVADILNKKGSYNEAVDLYQAVALNQPKTELAQIAEFKRGYTYLYDLKDYKKAKETFDSLKIFARGSNLNKYIDNKALPNVLNRYRREGFLPLIEGYKGSSSLKYKEALKTFDEILVMSPDDGVVFAGKALAYFWLDDPDKAIQFAKKAVKSSPRNEIASANLAYIYIRLKLFEEAISESKRFIADAPGSVMGYYNLGIGYVMTNKLEEAVTAFRKAIKVDPRFVMAYNNLGWCCWRLRRHALAIEAFEKAVKLNPNFFDALFNLAVVYNSIDRYEEAKKLFTKVLKLEPTSTIYESRIQ